MPAAGSCTTSPGCGFIKANDAIDQRARREILPRPGFFLGGVLLQKTFIEIAEALFARGEPIELVDRVGERLEIGRLAQLGLSVGEDGEHDLVFGLFGVAEIEQELAIVFQLIKPFAASRAFPTGRLWAGGLRGRFPPAS